MKKVKIVYNPFLLTTVITVDGKKPRENSSLDFQKQRLQEWAEKLPKILLEEYRDKNVSVEFTGTLDDFTDLKEILKGKSDIISVSQYVHHRTPDVADVERQVIEIFNDIEAGPVEALKDSHIKKAFVTARNSEFSINVVATMSAGKSSLINSLLGKNLMPVANLATTATIVRIIATKLDHYEGIAFNSKGEKLFTETDLTLKVMKEWNSNDDISAIDIYGPIPCVDNVGMRLIIVDTPGPNNSRDENHKKLTYEMLAASEKSLVLFVMNVTALDIDDEAQFLNYVCKCMKDGGKQSRDRFIFAVNKLDNINPENETVREALDLVKKGLDERDIKDPNIFPASALVASEIRAKAKFPRAVPIFNVLCGEGEEFHFDTYYSDNHLPIPSRARVGSRASGENAISPLELHSGIPSIEEAIRLYVNKYARTMKVRDLVDAFNKRLTELKAEAELQEHIENNKAEKERLDKEITRIQEEIDSGKSAKEYGKLIDRIDVSEEVQEEMDDLVGALDERIDGIVNSFDEYTRLPKDQAIEKVKKVQKEMRDIQSQLEARISKLFEKTFKRTFDQIMDVYKERLSRLGFQSTNHSFSFSASDFIGQEIANMDGIMRKSTQIVDEGYDTTRTKEEWTGQYETNWFWKPSTWGTKRKIMKKVSYTVHIPKNVEYVNMKQVVSDFFTPMQKALIQLEKEIPAQLDSQATEMKNHLKEELAKVDQLLQKKLQDIKDRMSASDRTAAQIAEQQHQLAWMRGIISRVNKLINY